MLENLHPVCPTCAKEHVTYFLKKSFDIQCHYNNCHWKSVRNFKNIILCRRAGLCHEFSSFLFDICGMNLRVSMVLSNFKFIFRENQNPRWLWGDTIQALEFLITKFTIVGVRKTFPLTKRIFCLQNTWKSDWLMDCLSLLTVLLSPDISNRFSLIFRWREYEDFILFHNHSALSAGDLVTTLLRTRIWNLDTITKNSDGHAVLSKSFDLT